MSAETVLWAVVAALGLVALVAGSAAVRRGLRARRGDAPHCRRCGYALVGIASDRCPECGTALEAGNVALGEPARRPGLIGGGAVLCLLGLLLIAPLGVGAYQSFDPYRLRPTGWVLDDLNSPSPAVAGRAWAELQRRMQYGDLAPAHRQRLARHALAEQAAKTTGPMTAALVDWLGEAALAGKLPGPMREQFFRQVVQPELRVRPRVALTEPIPYELAYRSRLPGENWWARLETVDVVLDGKHRADPSGGDAGFSGVGGAGTMGSQVRCNEPGRHTLTVGLRVRVFHGPNAYDDAHDPAARAVHEQRFSASATAEVLAEAEPTVKFIRDPALGPRIAACIRPRGFRWAADGNGLSGELEVRNVPVNIAFDLAARVGGKEYALGSMTLKQGGTTTFMRHDRGFDPPADERAFDLVLRSSERAARRTVHLFEIWEGEIVLTGVPVTAEKATAK